MARNNTNATVVEPITFAELVEVREAEMASILPGFQTEVVWNGRRKFVQSPERRNFPHAVENLKAK